MKKNNYENIDKENKTPKIAIYIRVGSMEQLNFEAEEKHLNLKTDSSNEKVRCIIYASPTEI